MNINNLEPLLNYGILGVMFILVILGILIPKWVVDEYRIREKVKDDIITALTRATERIADQMEAKK